jgi:hypothetical protein
MAGLALLAVAAQGAVTQIDDEDAGYGTTGAWSEEAAPNAHNDDEYWQSDPANDATATWSFSGLAAGNYYISASWVAGGNRTPVAVYAMSDGIPSATINQQLGVSFGFDDGQNVGYARLSSFDGYVAHSISDGTLDVTVSDADLTKFLMVDSVRIETARPDVTKVYVIDNEDATGYSETGAGWATHAGDANDHRADLRYGSVITSTATYAFTGVDDGIYRVSANWGGSPNRPTDATYIIPDVGSVVVNQQVTPSDDTFEDSPWKDLFPWVEVSGGTLSVTVSNGVGGAGGTALIADAVRLEKITPPSYAKVEDFQSHGLGADVDTANGWVEFGQALPAGGSVIQDPVSIGNKVAQLTGAAANDGYILPLGGNAVAEGTSATVFFRYRSGGGMSGYLTDADALHVPAPNWWDEDEAGIFNNEAQFGQNVKPHWSSATVVPLDYDAWYNVWVWVDHTANTFNLYMSKDFDTAVGDATSVTIDTGVGLRGGAGAGDLDHFFFVSNNNTTGGMIDDIHIAQGANLHLPDAVAPLGGTLFIIR